MAGEITTIGATPSSFPWGWVIAGVIVIGGVAALTLSSGEEEASKEGWYTLLYNYPRGNQDRRLKSWAGPFKTKAEAEDRAEDEKDVWYPAVRHLKNLPSWENDPESGSAFRRRRRRSGRRA